MRCATSGWWFRSENMDQVLYLQVAVGFETGVVAGVVVVTQGD